MPLLSNALLGLWLGLCLSNLPMELLVVKVILMGRFFNLLTPNVNYSGRTAPITSKVAFYIFIQQI